MRIVKVLLLFLMFALCPLIFAENEPAQSDDNLHESGNDEAGTIIPGFIFTTNNLLLDIDAYKGGIGGKIYSPEMSLRGSLGGLYENVNDKLELYISLSIEFPFFINRVTPYWGGGLTFGYVQEQSAYGDDWTRNAVLTGSVGGIIGAEIFITDYFSIFAEYELSAGISNSNLAQSAGGEVTEVNTTNFQIKTDLGNNAAIGIVLYIEPINVIADSEK